jgi:NodT family efflux transporter outer membrane factor (OMF) lipoprotein
MPRKIAFLMASLTLAACMPVPPPRPETVPLPSQWDTPVAVGKSAARTDWWKAIGDPALDRLVTEALRANTDVALAAARVLQARAQLAEADAAMQPSVQAEAEVDRIRIPAFKFGGERQPPQDSTWPYAGFGLDYEIDILGRLARAARSAQGELAASELDREQARRSVVFEVVRAYADWCLAERQLRNQERRQAWAEALLDEERHRLAAGVSTWRRVNEAEREAQALRTERVRDERDRDLARASLALLTARPLAHLPLAAGPDAGPAFKEVTVEADLPASTIGRRVDVQAAWQRLEAATIDIERAQLERYPRVTLTGLLGIAGSGFSGWLASDALAWIAGVAASLPIYDGGRVKAQVDAAAALRAERQADYRKTVYQALTEVEAALIQWQSALGVLERERRQAELRRRDLENETRALELGRASRPDVLRLRLASGEADAAVDAALHGRLRAYAGVQQALGR